MTDFFTNIERIVEKAGGIDKFKQRLLDRWKIPVNTWAVEVEVRPKGSQGKFEKRIMAVRAEENDVTRFVIEDCDMKGLEPRFNTKKRRIG